MLETYQVISTTLVVNGYFVNVEKCKINRICRFYFILSRLNNFLLPKELLIVFL
jgi:hypothetical protein